MKKRELNITRDQLSRLLYVCNITVKQFKEGRFSEIDCQKIERALKFIRIGEHEDNKQRKRRTVC